MFRLPEVDMDMFPITGPTAMAVFQLVQAHAKDMLLSGRNVFLEELDKWGTITRICSPQDLTKTVDEFAQKLAQKKVFLMNTIKPAINMMSFAQALDLFEVENQLQAFKTSLDGEKTEETVETAEMPEMSKIVKKIQSLWKEYGKGAPTF
ncbi:MAG: enoyl-CoA hydratase-related protein [Promethearchaeota archaeon]